MEDARSSTPLMDWEGLSGSKLAFLGKNANFYAKSLDNCCF